MKIFLDDERDPEMAAFEGWMCGEDHIYYDTDWVIVRSVNGFTRLLNSMDSQFIADGHIECISFDHDLGTDETGYDVMLILENMANENEFKCDNILVHTANASAQLKMLQCANKIMEMSK